MKHKIVNQHKKNFDPEYNPHLKKNYHSKLKTGKKAAKVTFMSIMIAVIVALIATAGGVLLYRDANQQAKQNVAQKVEKNAKPESPVYDQASLNQRSDHNVDKGLMNQYAHQDSFVDKITYDSKKDVAKVYLTKSAANAINYASNAKKAKPNQLKNDIKKGVKIDNVLSNQAVNVANQAHDGYFTFTFANAKAYQAPNTKTGNYKE